MMASCRHSEMEAVSALAGGHLAAFLFGWSVSGEGEIPACAGMTVVGAGMTVMGAGMTTGEDEIPACAGMTVVGAGMTTGEGEIPACAGMTVMGAGMTTEVKPPDWNAAQAFGKAAAGGHDGV